LATKSTELSILTYVAFRMPDLKHGMHCLPSYRT